MGFGDLASTAIMFIAVLILTAGISALILAHINNFSTGVTRQQSLLADQIATDIEIDYAYYNAGSEELTLWIKNTGNRAINDSQLTVFVGDQLFAPDSTSRSSNILADSKIIDDALLHPAEIATVTINNNFAGGIYEVKVLTAQNTETTYTLGV